MTTLARLAYSLWTRCLRAPALLSLLTLLALSAASCSVLLDFDTSKVHGLDGGKSPDGSSVKTASYSLDSYDKLDLLFVLDTSQAPGQLQKDVVSNLDGLVSAIYGSSAPDLHVGVITSDLGVGSATVTGCTATGNGAQLLTSPATAGCLAEFVNPYFNDVPGMTNYSGDLGKAFGCVANPLPQGCVYQQPLAAAIAALGGSVTANAGFLRPDAALAVLFVSEAEDCSTQDPSLFDPTVALPAAFRCFDYGVTCSGFPDPTVGGVRTGGCAATANPMHLGDPTMLAKQLGSLAGTDTTRTMLGALAAAGSGNLVQVKNDSTTGNQPIEEPVACGATTSPRLAPDFRVAAAVASFGIRGLGAAATDVCAQPISALVMPTLGPLIRSDMQLICLPAGVSATPACSAQLVASDGESRTIASCTSAIDAGPRPDFGPRSDSPPGDHGPPHDATFPREAAPPADGGVLPTGCFTIVAGDSRCGSFASIALTLSRPAPAGTMLQVSCK